MIDIINQAKDCCYIALKLSRSDMKNSFIVSFLVLISCTSTINQEIPSQYYNYNILIGEVDWDGLTREPYNEWFTPNYLSYQVDTTSLSSSRGNLEEIKIVAFIGSWCEDSQIQLPQFYKILDYLGFDLNNLRLEAIDRSEDGLVFSPLCIENMVSQSPEFIFFKSGKEIGRISEYPEETLEKDMVKIIEQTY